MSLIDLVDNIRKAKKERDSYTPQCSKTAKGAVDEIFGKLTLTKTTVVTNDDRQHKLAEKKTRDLFGDVSEKTYPTYTPAQNLTANIKQAKTERDSYAPDHNRIAKEAVSDIFGDLTPLETTTIALDSKQRQQAEKERRKLFGDVSKNTEPEKQVHQVSLTEKQRALATQAIEKIDNYLATGKGGDELKIRYGTNIDAIPGYIDNMMPSNIIYRFIYTITHNTDDIDMIRAAEAEFRAVKKENNYFVPVPNQQLVDRLLASVYGLSE